jgi:hypothetical protein
VTVLINNNTKLLALLSLPQLTPVQLEQINALIKKVDLNELYCEINQHRIWPTVYLNIKKYFSNQFNSTFQNKLEKKYNWNKYKSQHQLQMLSKILQAFKKQTDIPIASFKGNLLTYKLYGDITFRHSNDLDLFINKRDFIKANDILCQLGFTATTFSKLNSKQQLYHFEAQKDVIYTDGSGQLIELHYRFFIRPTKLDIYYGTSLLNNKKDADILEFIYLCWHGAQNLYHRLKWLTDIACYINKNKDNLDVFASEVLKNSYKLEASRYVIVSWLLSHYIFNSELPEVILEKSKKCPLTKLLINNSIKMIQTHQCVDSTQFKLQIYLSEFLFSTSIKDKLILLNHLVLKPNDSDIARFPRMPKKLYFMFTVWRPFMLLHRIFIKR